MTIDMSQFIAVFFDEAAEHLASLESLLLKIDITAPDPEDLNAIFRAAHSIKGGAATFGFSDLTEVTHVLENLLDRIRKNEITLTAEMVDAFLQSGDVLQAMLACHRDQQAMDQEQISQITATLNHLLSDQTPIATPVNSEPTGLDQEPVESDDSFGFFTPEEPRLEVDEGFGFFDPQFETSAQTNQIENSEENGYGFFQPLATPISNAAAASNEPVNAAPVRTVLERASDKNTDSSIRVSVEKVDQLLNLVGELVITQSMLAQNSLQLDPVLHEKLLSGVAQLERNTRELQESVMSIRMMPISFVFNRYPRLVRDLAAKLGKQVELRMIGESTELDKGFIEKLSDPLTHLVRNSLDHGIESPEKRRSQNKPAQGILTLKAFHQGGNIVIEVSDDGAGLHREKILAKARERGINVSDSMTDNEVWLLIFEAGFSTAAEITDVSGRGVGMDVVRKNIQAMGGRVEIQSITGIGSTISIRLPLTLAILDGMSISASDEFYIIPLTFIIESLQPKTADIKSMAGRGSVINVRGEYLPLVALYEIFNLPHKEKRFEDGLVIILEAEGQKIALFVDDLLGQHQVVVKNLETNYRRVHGVAGATIMGDGHVAFILDVAALVKMAQHVSAADLNKLAA